MAFLETPRFPGCVAFGALGGPNYSTVRTVVASGFDDVLIRYEQPIHRYTFEHANRTQTEHDALLTFFHAVKGMGHRFRIKDYSDYLVTTEGVLRPLHSTLQVGSSGFGYGAKLYQLQKLYSAGALGTYRDIYKPVSPTVRIFRAGVLQTLTTHYTIDYTTGVITFVADDSRAISSHVVGTQHVLNLASAMTVGPGQRIFVTGVTGTAATTLNDLSHEVFSVSVAQVTLTTNTTGMTASGGTAAMYPQSNQTLTWDGEFDVPVRFLSDEASFEIVNREGGQGLLYSWSGINLTEVRIAL